MLHNIKILRPRLFRSFSLAHKQHVNTEFVKPIEDFHYDSKFFAKLSFDLANKEKFDSKT